MRLMTICLCFAVLALSLGCSHERPAQTIAPVGANPADLVNVRVRITNQSFQISPVDIRVLIDGREVVNQSFLVGDQHTYESFFVNLPAGEHEVSIESTKVSARYHGRFKVTQKDRYAEIAFTTEPNPKFSFFVVDENRKID